MGLIVDGVMILIVLLSIFLGYRKGFISLSVKLLAFIIAIVLTLILYNPITNMVINVTSIDESIQEWIIKEANTLMTDSEDAQVKNELIESAKNGLLPQTSRELSLNIVRFGVAIILFLVIRIGLMFVTALANLVAKIPVIKQINELGGIVYGLLRGILLIYVALFLVGIFGAVNPKNSVNQGINDSTITKMMYENNIINSVFK